ncbi:Predicted secreted hydrolase [Andreprevotia lacus DSM 23236]|jgi:predicted secreted hydrolase|uniref:Predicted secreted hydrolase n=1 Tax=Andreprevotia lacus DSM 23236 TaxID=1121001 RepID=A0A1W1Y0X5_9NEIS|nr:lipocalin-like domain-containing protein [Andreprevotia lacus]SMC29441.1 Predicted secreted hydrolase [Andreprevotia lacus DSM 23236]
MTTSPQTEAPLQITAISLPLDQYGHAGAPTEWWWHIGTLHAVDGREFGFEINATGYSTPNGAPTVGFTQLAITDVANQTRYQAVTVVDPLPADWAQYDAGKPWYVSLSGPDGAGAITMMQLGGNPLDMAVAVAFSNAADGTQCQINLQLRQQGAPLLVWGTGVEEVDPTGTTPVTKNNFYYSLTRLAATGAIVLGDEVIAVSGLTWMDHEYGAFPAGTPGRPDTWLLQDVQLDNGIHLSNFTEFGQVPQDGEPMKSHATVLLPGGKSVFIPTTTTPHGPVYTSAKGVDYFLKIHVELDTTRVVGYDVPSSLTVTSLCPDQLFLDGPSADVYEGVCHCEAHFDSNLINAGISQRVQGTAWVEQNLGNGTAGR